MSKDRIIYVLSLIASILIAAVMFASWNMSKSRVIDTQGKQATSLRWAVEGCDVSKDYVSLKGWAYLPNLGRVKINIYAEDNEGGFRKLNKTSFHVPGVNESLGLSQYELPGFFAAKRIIGNDNFSGKFMIEAIDLQGNESYATYECK
ncbi:MULTISPECIES: hypothetical protein [Enterobacter]|uniref:hypothetical protein n=1 Tax=Enterobacter TaxID=547 RepID=UPI0005F9A0A8|nr:MULTISPECIES: hypothetical protein [Enterobacter]KJW99553.1 hypothetical protein RZ87_09455 [Enterobacter roggenkampii]MBA7742020.1 hypothetical protein [Enterobacter roggenkampii]MBT2028920.1 hypothetical protein [Enterobacter roggenkampii]MBT2033461.1 hypothetical protein [Enterobacter roggenkampii]MCK7307321.1 hypothetical protein [Enterobacter quasiroggenkampii]